MPSYPAAPARVPYRDHVQQQNFRIIRAAVETRFPAWADQCEPYVNVLTLQEWNRRGYRVKKGERSIRVFTQIPVTKREPESGKKKIVGWRPGKAFVFALPQVEKKA